MLPIIGNYVTMREQDGALRISLNEAGKQEIHYHAGCSIHCLLEHEQANGLVYFIDPTHINAMTEAPIVCFDVDFAGDEVIVPASGAPVYFYAEYMIRNPLEELEKHGFVDFMKVPDDTMQGSPHGKPIPTADDGSSGINPDITAPVVRAIEVESESPESEIEQATRAQRIAAHLHAAGISVPRPDPGGRLLDEVLHDRTRLLEACDLVLATRSTLGHHFALDNLRQIVESVRK